MEQTVFFLLTGTDGPAAGQTFARAVITDLLGRARLGTLVLPAGVYAVQVRFPGTASYTAAVSEVGSLRVDSRPVAADDAYSSVEDTPLTVPAPGVLGNDQDPDGEPLAASVVTSTVSGSLTLAADGSFVYTPAPGFYGADSFVYQACDGAGLCARATVRITVQRGNQPPSCAGVFATTTAGDTSIWPLNKEMVEMRLQGAVDSDGDVLTYRFLRIFQDEEVGAGGNSPDGAIADSCRRAQVRAERDGSGDGRVYHLFYRVEDGRGGICTGDATIPTVPHDQGGSGSSTDGGPLFNALGDGVGECEALPGS
jgi:hypothetical protein